MQRDFISNFKETIAVVPSVHTADADGSSVDMLGFNYVTFYAILGDSGDTLSGSVMIELEVEESADDSSFTDVADDDLQGYVAGTNDGCFGLINAPAEDQTFFTATYKGSKRYVRPVVNVTGTHSNGTIVGIIAIQHGAQNLPVS